MNGRCENDALDAAIDVCDACGGEFCDGCLLFPSGPKKAPLCKACAIGNSGVRNRAKRERVQSRSSASKRRKELRKLAAEQKQKNVVVVEDLPDFYFDEPVEVEVPKKKRLRRKGDPAQQPVEAAEVAVPPPNPEPVPQADAIEHSDAAAHDSASKRLADIRTNGAIEPPLADSSDVWNFPTDFDAEPEAGSEVDEEPKGSDLEWETLHNPDASNPFDDPSVGRLNRSDGNSSDYQTAFPAPDTDVGPMFDDDPTLPPPPQHKAPLPQRNPSEPKHQAHKQTPGPQHRSPAPPPAPSEGWHNDPALAAYHPEEISRSTPTDSLPAAPAPLVQPPPPAPRKKKRSLLSGRDNTPAPAPPPPVVQSEVVQEKVQDPTTDTDASGRWIPPNLRGMVSADQQTELPKRQRG